MISVIIPVYNSENYLQRMIDSILIQSYQDFEVVFIDDGSTDESGYLCDQAVKKESRFKVIHQKNNGAGSARNAGLKHALGEWVAFLDSDDQIPDNYFEALMNRQSETRADLVVCDVEMRDEKGELLSAFICKDRIIDAREGLDLLLSRKELNSGPCGKLIRKNVAVSSSFPELKTYEDLLYMKDILCNTNTIAFTNKTKYIYYQHESGLMANNKTSPSKDIVAATDDLVTFIKNRNDLSDECLYITLSHLYQYVITQIKQNGTESKSFVKCSQKVFVRCLGEIINNSAFPWKEKVLYFLFAIGMDVRAFQKQR